MANFTLPTFTHYTEITEKSFKDDGLGIKKEERGKGKQIKNNNKK